MENEMSLDDLAALLDEDDDELASLVIPEYEVPVSSQGKSTSNSWNDTEVKSKATISASGKADACSSLDGVKSDLVLSDDEAGRLGSGNDLKNSGDDPSEMEIVALERRLQTLKERRQKNPAPQSKNLEEVVGKIHRPAPPNLTQHLEALPPALATTVQHCVREGEGRRLEGRLRTMLKPRGSEVHAGDTDSSDDDDNRNPFEDKYNEFGKAVKRIARTTKCSSSVRDQLQEKAEHVNRLAKSALRDKPTVKRDGSSKQAQSVPEPDDFVMIDSYNKISVMNPRLSQSDLQECFRDKQRLLISRLQQQVRGETIPGEWVTIGVIARKSDPRTSQKGSAYSSWTLTDLVDCQKPVKLMLFGEAHAGLWKTGVGSVVALAGARVMKDRDLGNASVVLSINSARNCIILGTSCDLDFCKAKCKNGKVCLTFLNKRQCPVCVFHMTAEYKKVSSKRTELQGCSGVTPKEREIGGGSDSAASRDAMRVVTKSGADKLRMASLGYQKASEAALANKNRKLVIDGKHLTDEEVKAIASVSTKSYAVGEFLMKPCAGSRNLLKHITQPPPVPSIDGGATQPAAAGPVASGRQLLMAEAKSRAPLPAPRLARDMAQGGLVDLGGAKPSGSTYVPVSINKRRAVELIRKSGGLQKPNPNQVRSRPDPTRVQQRLRASLDNENEAPVSTGASLSSDNGSDGGPAAKQARRSEDALQRIRAAIATKSAHAATLDVELNEQQEVYFQTLEKKEMVENKMLDTWEIKTKAVYCPKCKYRALGTSELCKAENHPCIAVDAVKRFFACANCKNRTFSLDKLPRFPCKNCGQESWKRAPMGRERTGPKLDSEILSICGNDSKYVNSYVKDRNINL